MPLRAEMPNTVKNPTSDPSEITPPPMPVREHAADESHRQGQEDQQREPPAAERDLQQQQDRETGDDRDAVEVRLRGLPLLVLAEQFGVVAAWERDARRSAFLTSATTEPRSRWLTLAATSRRRESFSRSMTLGTGPTLTLATSPRRTTVPDGVSIGRALTACTLVRVCGVLHTTVSYALPSRKMSPTSSPATRVAAARRTSPGFRPYFAALARLTSTWICGWSS